MAGSHKEKGEITKDKKALTVPCGLELLGLGSVFVAGTPDILEKKVQMHRGGDTWGEPSDWCVRRPSRLMELPT